MKLLYLVFTVLFCWTLIGDPIETPDIPERNKFVIRVPTGWGYRTFKGDNGLIGVLWPRGTSFNKCDTAIFVFIQDFNSELPDIPANAHLYSEKCNKSQFKFSNPETDSDKTVSIEEKYFAGPCGKTEIIFEERVENYRIVTLLASARYVSHETFDDAKFVAQAYRIEVEKSLAEEAQRRQNQLNQQEENQQQEYPEN